jgi:hypothetical protein
MQLLSFLRAESMMVQRQTFGYVLCLYCIPQSALDLYHVYQMKENDTLNVFAVSGVRHLFYSHLVFVVRFVIFSFQN